MSRDRLPFVIGHRGAPRLAPENTLASLCAAKNAGARWVEFDVLLTQDDVPVILHDPDVSRTTNGHGQISEHYFSAVERLDAGSWFSSAFQAEPVPTLRHYLRYAALLGLGVNVEIKPSAQPVLVAQIVAEALGAWPATLPQPLISSFSVEALQAMRALSPDYCLGSLHASWDDDIIARAQALQCWSVHCRASSLTGVRIVALKAAGFRVLAYVVNDLAQAQALRAEGVDAIFSDNDQLFNLESASRA